MQYAVETVADDDLPGGLDRLIVERDDGSALLLISGVYAECWRFMRAWEDSLEPCDVPSILLPAYPMLRAV